MKYFYKHIAYSLSLTRVTRWVLLVEQGRLIHPELMHFHVVIALPVLIIHFDIFKL